MSPLPITGTPRSAATLPTRSQSAALLYRCSRVRPWIAMASAPFSSQARATSDTLILSSCQPARSLTVTGMETAAFMAATSRPTFVGLRSRLAPRPRRVIWSIGQPQFRSTKRAPRDSASRAPSTRVSVLLSAS